jgi:hypothetical protein
MKTLMKIILLGCMLASFALHTKAQDMNTEPVTVLTELDMTESPAASELLAFNDQPEQRTPELTFAQLPAPEEPTVWEQIWAWLKVNWAEALLGLMLIIETIVNLTPTERDNAWFKWLRDIVNSIIPNRKKGGGTHTSPPAS